LFVIGLLVFFPRDIYKKDVSKLYHTLKKQLPFIIIIIGVVIFHVLEVNIIDPIVTDWVGIDFASKLQVIENGFVIKLAQQHWIPSLVMFFVTIYIIVYLFILWFTPLYFLVADEEKSMKTLSYGLLLTYTIALPFYLILPITNVYTYYGIQSPLNMMMPGVEDFFYMTTTQNNCLPSLHVAMVLLIARSTSFTKNKLYSYFVYTLAMAVIISVIYLAIHWILDVVSGITLALSVQIILKKTVFSKKSFEPLINREKG